MLTRQGEGSWTFHHRSAGLDLAGTVAARGTDQAGRKVDNLGDINGDGLEDLLVGAPQASQGSACILWGDTEITSRGLADSDVKFRSSRTDDQLGYSVQHLDDLNDDGWPDLFLSENQADAWAYVFFGPLSTTATFQASDANLTLAGDTSDRVYETAFTPGDFTGDGVSDLFVGPYKYGVDWDGIVYLIPGAGL